MREIQAAEITKVVRDLFIDANCNLGEDILAAFDRGIAMDESPVAKEVLKELKENARIARDEQSHAFCKIGIRQKQPEIPSCINPLPRRQSGFTLIEIAIVLVIIGLLLGGILKGQELITQGRIRNVGNDFQSMTAAINLYQDRYRALPGDDAGAAARWSVTAPSGGTLGDGIISGAYNSATATDESRQFWLHLRRAGLVGGAVTDDPTPPNAAYGRTGVQNGAQGIPGIVVCSNNLPAKIAQSVDSQFDDGNATSGTVRGNTGTTPSATAPADNYEDSGDTFYVVCKAP